MNQSNSPDSNKGDSKITSSVPLKEDLVWADCADCNGIRRHRVIKQHMVYHPVEIVRGYNNYQIVECVGCESVRFRRESMDEYRYQNGQDSSIDVYPKQAHLPWKANRELAGLETVGGIYQETCIALDNQLWMLTAAGLRACVEAVCKHENIDGNSLVDKIKNLENKQLLTASQANLLHAARYIGNRSLHDIVEPKFEHLQITMRIIESLLETTYILPIKANQIEKLYSSNDNNQVEGANKPCRLDE